MVKFFKKAFADMKASAREQQKVDRKKFEAVKAESRANWEEAKTAGSPSAHRKAQANERNAQYLEAEARIDAANARINAAKQARR